MVPDITDPRPGDPDEIGGYRVLGRLGAGGQGVVYLATGPSGERVAIKQLLSGFGDERARAQFAKEVAAVRRVAPFCTAQVLDVKLEGPSPYLISEYIEGPSLQQQVREHGPMQGAGLQRLAIGTVTALAAIHQAGVVHRDFTPANVMLAADGPRVIDFGIARDLSTETTATSRVFGTPAYMAPEQLRAERVGPATDMFAWASVIAYAATGRAPFEASHMMAVVHRITTGEPDLTGVPVELQGILRRCLDKDPARRPSAPQTLALLLGRPAGDPANETQVLAEATSLVHNDVTPAAAPWGSGNLQRTVPGPPRPLRSAGRNGGRVLLAIAVALLLIGAGWALVHYDLPGSGRAGSPTGTPTPTAAGHPSGAGAPTTAPATASPTSTPVDPATSTPTPAATDTVPGSFAGTWTGSAYQFLGQRHRWTAQLQLTQGQTTGEMTLPELGCSESLTVTSASEFTLSLAAKVTADPKNICASSGTVKLVTTALGELSFFWQDATKSTNFATARLHH